MSIESPARREFIRTGVSALGAFVLSLNLPACGDGQRAPAAFTPDAFIRVNPDGLVTIVLGVTEMGQGVFTSLPMLIAEEMEVDLSSVRVDAAPTDARYNHPGFGRQMTGGSLTLQSFWTPFRRAGAIARIMLVNAAAQRWKVAPETCTARNGAVVHGPSGRSLKYGELASTAGLMTAPAEVVLKDPRNFRLIGRPTKRLDSLPKTTGKSIFGIDVAVPGMLTAVVARPPVFGGRVRSFSAEKALAVPGVRRIVPTDAGIAVVADGFWPAKQGREALDIAWDEGPLATLDAAAQAERYAQLAHQPGLPVTRKGLVEPAFQSADKVIEATYEVPYLAHACMEPLNFVAHVQEGRLELWSGTQFQSLDRQAAAKETGIPLENIQLHTAFAGGGFGRRWASNSGPVREAVQISKAVKAPVKVIWTREDDIQGGWYRPRYTHWVKGGVDRRGNLTAWQHRIVGQPIFAGRPGLEQWATQGEIDSGTVSGAQKLLYSIPNHHLDAHNVPDGPPVQPWRSVGSSHNAFVTECFLDELAHLASKDPLEYRRELLGQNPRLRRVLDLAAEKAGWGKPLPPGHALGIAVSEFHTVIAQVAEVSVSANGEIRVHRVVCGADGGILVNPTSFHAQIEGGIVFGLSAALFGEITLERGRAQQSNFHDYRIVSMEEMPRIEIHTVASNEPPRGVGESAVPAIAPAVANAVYAATGKRIRRLPLHIS